MASDVVSRAKRRVGLETPSAADADGNVGIVRGALRAFGSGEVDGFLETLKDDVSWEAPAGQRFPGSGKLSGRDDIRDRFLADVRRTFTSFGFRPDSFLDADEENAVVVIGRFEGEGVEGGSLDVPGVQLWEFQGNSAARICIFTDSASFPEVVTEDDERRREREEESDDDDSGSSEASHDEDERSESSDEEQPKASRESDSGEQPD